MPDSLAPISVESLLMRPGSCRHLRPKASSPSVVACRAIFSPPAQLAWKAAMPALSANTLAAASPLGRRVARHRVDEMRALQLQISEPIAVGMLAEGRARTLERRQHASRVEPG